jgi:hypothetical protein
MQKFKKISFLHDLCGWELSPKEMPAMNLYSNIRLGILKSLPKNSISETFYKDWSGQSTARRTGYSSRKLSPKIPTYFFNDPWKKNECFHGIFLSLRHTILVKKVWWHFKISIIMSK